MTTKDMIATLWIIFICLDFLSNFNVYIQNQAYFDKKILSLILN